MPGIKIHVGWQRGQSRKLYLARRALQDIIFGGLKDYREATLSTIE